MLMETEFQILAPWYLIDFWHREKENFGIYRFFLVVDWVRQLWIEEIGKKRRDTGRKIRNYPQNQKNCAAFHPIFLTKSLYATFIQENYKNPSAPGGSTPDPRLCETQTNSTLLLSKIQLRA